MNDKIPLQVPAYLTKFTSLTSGGIKFDFITQENIDPDLLTEFFKNKNKLGNLLFAVRQIEFIDIAKLPAIDKSKYIDGKSKSQRLRSVLYLIHEAKGGTKEMFNDYYDEVMEKLIDHYKNILSEL
jgi:hypothetical protein